MKFNKDFLATIYIYIIILNKKINSSSFCGNCGLNLKSISISEIFEKFTSGKFFIFV